MGAGKTYYRKPRERKGEIMAFGLSNQLDRWAERHNARVRRENEQRARLAMAERFERERATRFQQGLQPLQQVVDLFGPSYMRGVERTALANVDAGLISRGLGSTTRPVAMSVGMKGQFEDIRRGRLADALAMMSRYTQQMSPTPSTFGTTLAQSGSLPW